MASKNYASPLTNPTPSSRTCMCSPTNHPGSFRCSMHKKPPRVVARSPSHGSNNHNHHWDSSSSMALKAVSMKAMILLQRMKPSNHDLHRRKNFQPKPTRFSLMNGGAVAVS